MTSTGAMLKQLHVNKQQDDFSSVLQSADHWCCITHLSAEDMLKSAIFEEKKLKHSPYAGAENPLGPEFLCKQEGLITMVICCKFKKNLFNL